MNIVIQTNNRKYGLVPKGIEESFEEAALQIYRDAASKGKLPIVSKHHLIDEDTYELADSLEDLMIKLYTESAAAAHVFDCDNIDQWGEEEYFKIDEMYKEDSRQIEREFLWDLTMCWDERGITFVDETNPVTQDSLILNQVLQEVW